MRFIFLSALLVLAAAQEEEVVTITSQQEFDDFISANVNTMVEFYAPWCGHCKKLAPEYDQAAAELKEDGVPLAKVDCTDEEGGKDVCGKYEVRGYPTLKFFQNGKDTPYEQDRSKDAIVKYIRSRMGPAITALDSADVAEKFSKKDSLVIIHFSESVHDDYENTANGLRDKMSFGHASSEDIATALEVPYPSIVLFRSFDEPKIEFSGDITADNIEKFITDNSFPLVGAIGPQNYKDYMDRGLPLMWIAVASDDHEVIDWAREQAPDFAGKLSMVHIDGVQFESHIKNLGHEGDLPGVIITDGPKKFLLKGEITKDSVGSFLKDYDGGDLQPFLKSEPIPEDNDEPVTVLVGKSFDDIVINNDNDVLVEFYAPWCGHCKKLEPEYDDLGTRWADNDKVVVAKMDSTENDGPIEISGFPTLVFFKSGDKANHETYRGERTADALHDFLQNNAVHASAGAEADATKADATKADATKAGATRTEL